MQRFIIVCMFVVTMYTLIGCASHQGSQLDTSRDLQNIRKVLTQWQEAYQEKDVKRYVDTFWKEGFYTVFSLK